MRCAGKLEFGTVRQKHRLEIVVARFIREILGTREQFLGDAEIFPALLGRAGQPLSQCNAVLADVRRRSTCQKSFELLDRGMPLRIPLQRHRRDRLAPQAHKIPGVDCQQPVGCFGDLTGSLRSAASHATRLEGNQQAVGLAMSLCALLRELGDFDRFVREALSNLLGQSRQAQRRPGSRNTAFQCHEPFRFAVYIPAAEAQGNVKVTRKQT
mmetsp:Transcript_63313/g.182091  ORF Transcript_63313/g.182091 Transcript_63313/m.182091 type:complete len:212 (+) Transcript_63313:823-1458(+)